MFRSRLTAAQIVCNFVALTQQLTSAVTHRCCSVSFLAVELHTFWSYYQRWKYYKLHMARQAQNAITSFPSYSSVLWFSFSFYNLFTRNMSNPANYQQFLFLAVSVLFRASLSHLKEANRNLTRAPLVIRAYRGISGHDSFNWLCLFTEALSYSFSGAYRSENAINARPNFLWVNVELTKGFPSD